MIQRFVVAAAGWAFVVGSASACSLPKREHQLLASSRPLSVPKGWTLRQVALDEGLLPADRASAANLWNLRLGGVRGLAVEDGVVRNGAPVEVRGSLDLVCFYPSEQYRYSDGRLIVWVTGLLREENGKQVLELSRNLDWSAEKSVWVRMRWNEANDR